MFSPVPVSAGWEKTTLLCSGRFRLSSCLIDVEDCDGAGDGLDFAGAATVRLLAILLEADERLALKPLIWLSRYDMMLGAIVKAYTDISSDTLELKSSSRTAVKPCNGYPAVKEARGAKGGGC